MKSHNLSIRFLSSSFREFFAVFFLSLRRSYVFEKLKNFYLSDHLQLCEMEFHSWKTKNAPANISSRSATWKRPMPKKNCAKDLKSYCERQASTSDSFNIFNIFLHSSDARWKDSWSGWVSEDSSFPLQICCCLHHLKSFELKFQFQVHRTMPRYLNFLAHLPCV